MFSTKVQAYLTIVYSSRFHTAILISSQHIRSRVAPFAVMYREREVSVGGLGGYKVKNAKGINIFPRSDSVSLRKTCGKED